VKQVCDGIPPKPAEMVEVMRFNQGITA